MNYTTPESIELYVACLYEPDDLLELRILPRRHSEWHEAEKLASQSARLIADNCAGQNIYVGVNPRHSHGGRNAAAVQLARCLVADFDGNPTIGETTERLATAGLPEPTIAIYSGHGVHFYWRLAEPITDLAEWTKLQKALIAAIGSDPSIHDPPRIMRLPGFYNCKFSDRVPCSIVWADPTRRNPNGQLREILAPHLVAQSIERPAVQTTPIGNDDDRVARWWGAATRVTAIDKGDGSGRLLKVARQAVRFDLPDDVAIDQIERYQRAFPFPTPWSANDVRRRLRDAEKQCVRGDGLRRRRGRSVGHEVVETRLDAHGDALPPPIGRAIARAIKKRRAKASRKGGGR